MTAVEGNTLGILLAVLTLCMGYVVNGRPGLRRGVCSILGATIVAGLALYYLPRVPWEALAISGARGVAGGLIGLHEHSPVSGAQLWSVAVMWIGWGFVKCVDVPARWWFGLGIPALVLALLIAAGRALAPEAVP